MLRRLSLVARRGFSFWGSLPKIGWKNPRKVTVTVFDDLVFISEIHARRAREDVARQRATVERLVVIGDQRAVKQAKALQARLEKAYQIALYRLKMDCALSGRASPLLVQNERD